MFSYQRSVHNRRIACLCSYIWGKRDVFRHISYVLFFTMLSCRVRSNIGGTHLHVLQPERDFECWDLVLGGGRSNIHLKSNNRTGKLYESLMERVHYLRAAQKARVDQNPSFRNVPGARDDGHSGPASLVIVTWCPRKYFRQDTSMTLSRSTWQYQCLFPTTKLCI